MSEIDFMPIMTNVNAYFDARKEVTSTSWKNQTGDIDFQLFNPIQNEDGVEVVGSETSYGKFTKPWTSGSSRTWYFVFKTITPSTAFGNWKTIIGNESATYKCSTIAMDDNGFIKFTRPDIIPNTSLGFKCSDWHVVAWVSDASTSRTRLWIDGTYINYAKNMQGWSDDTYLGRGSGWWYEENNTVFRAIAIADSVHSDSDVVTNSQWLYDNYVTNYVNSFYEIKYLIRSNHSLYTIIDGTLTALQETLVESSLFSSKGFDELPDSSLLLGLWNPEILYWQSSTEDGLPTMTATMNATPLPQAIVTNPIDMSNPTIKGIQRATVSCTGNPLFACSFDDGATWKVHNGSEWADMVDSVGMTKTVLEEITTEQWSQVLEGLSSFKLWFILNTTEDTVTNVVIDYLNEGE